LVLKLVFINWKSWAVRVIRTAKLFQFWAERLIISIYLFISFKHWFAVIKTIQVISNKVKTKHCQKGWRRLISSIVLNEVLSQCTLHRNIKTWQFKHRRIIVNRIVYILLAINTAHNLYNPGKNSQVTTRYITSITSKQFYWIPWTVDECEHERRTTRVAINHRHLTSMSSGFLSDDSF